MTVLMNLCLFTLAAVATLSSLQSESRVQSDKNFTSDLTIVLN